METNITPSCGGIRTIIKEGKADRWFSSCKRWSCERCRAMKTRKLAETVQSYCQGPTVFLVRRTEQGRRLSYWVAHHKSQEPGSYTIRIGTITEAWVVSTHPFRNTGTDEAIEMGIGEFCDEWLPDYINKNFLKKPYVSQPRRLCKLPQPAEESIVPNNRTGSLTILPRDRSEEYNDLGTISEKADWLAGAEAQVIAARERKFIQTFKTNRGRLKIILPVIQAEIRADS